MGVERLDLLDARDIGDEQARALLGDRLLPAPDDVGGGHLVAEDAAHALAQREDVGPAVGRDGPALGEVRHHLREVEPPDAIGVHGPRIGGEALVDLRDRVLRARLERVAIDAARRLERRDDERLGERRRGQAGEAGGENPTSDRLPHEPAFLRECRRACMTRRACG